ncbi:MAG: hypothetical protein A2020_04745 [Lentisphaerae bacterium GWF2_45_14]|nr:MAG: hypothetical protein A2020_04745 [Lentisphaerae bacterium GWF2_45_14]
MKLSSILNPDLFFKGIPVGDRQSIYKSMLEKAAGEIKQDIDPEKIASEMVKREDAFSIPYEKGAALPHLRSPLFDDLYIIVGIPDSPVLLKNNDKDLSHVVIMSLVSEKTSDTYLKTLAAFSRFVIKNGGSVSRLTSCRDGNEFNALLDAENVILKKEITAEDIMDSAFPYVLSGTPLSEALDMFSKYSKTQLPVLDSGKRFIGVLDSENILRKSLPAHYMILDNVKIISGFEPFQHILTNEDKITVDEYIREPRAVAELSTPLIQLALMLIKNEFLNIFITDEHKQLVGIVTMLEIVQKVLRG